MMSRLLRGRRFTLIQWLVVAAVAAIMVAMFVPGTKWASSGAVTIPVDVLVFDPQAAAPIEGALVAIVWAPPATGEFEVAKYQSDLSEGFSAIEEIGSRTNREGVATIPHEFRTGANHERPASYAHTRWYWLLVAAEGYGSVAVPLRYESMVTKELKTQGRLPAYVGLTRTNSE